MSPITVYEHEDFCPAIRRLRRERDEARTEVERLRKNLCKVLSVLPWNYLTSTERDVCTAARDEMEVKQC